MSEDTPTPSKAREALKALGLQHNLDTEKDVILRKFGKIDDAKNELATAIMDLIIEAVQSNAYLALEIATMVENTIVVQSLAQKTGFDAGEMLSARRDMNKGVDDYCLSHLRKAFADADKDLIKVSQERDQAMKLMEDLKREAEALNSKLRETEDDLNAALEREAVKEGRGIEDSGCQDGECTGECASESNEKVVDADFSGGDTPTGDLPEEGAGAEPATTDK